MSVDSAIMSIEAANKIKWEAALSQIVCPPIERRTFAALEDAAMAIVMIEFREHAWLSQTLFNVTHVYGGSKDVGLVVVCGSRNERMVRNILEGYRGVVIRVLPRENVTISEYNSLLTSPEFYALVDPCPVMLLIQTDTLTRKRIPTSYIDKYSYIGAPWVGPQICGPTNGVVGNGGYSLRDVAAMKNACTLNKFSESEDKAEDLFFAKHGNGEIKKIAPVNVAMEFSVEHVPHPDPCGMHQAWRFHRPELLDHWLTNLPGKEKGEKKKIL